MLLPEPTEELVNSFIRNFDQTQLTVERALTKLFGLFPENTDLEDVLLKVVSLNDLYRTNIFATYRVAEHIQQLHVDPLLQAGDPQAVKQIAPVRIGNKIRTNYSFASKYCSWHRPNDYPIFDGYVEQILWRYQKQNNFSRFFRHDMRDYASFKRIIDDFREYFRLTEFENKHIDKFLWLAGKKYFPTSW